MPMRGESLEDYLEFKKDKFAQYTKKAEDLFRSIDDLSLEPKDRVKLKKKLIKRLDKIK